MTIAEKTLNGAWGEKQQKHAVKLNKQKQIGEN